MRLCPINDCTNFTTVAPCCTDCSEGKVCPDRCTNRDPMSCALMIDGDAVGKETEAKA